ncbi:amylo-alpha-1,6-glucosidase [Plantactinospora sp. S1510]|uniref:Amylo-alpha-1,6-glucosidase n=1 Tax=Plantactinospora alkalitolerans TaxID=2789879 RepID=A0ABS0H2I3_9ACTN|nr:glycogen debranching N-terminal domain-containing protein [Plantactinospora alkalitolerans]MBF9132662.1 amylo-alpha-1,6-glucosidase [Plantactinospora alkalitolerans]
MDADQVSILEGFTFLVSDRNGDVDPAARDPVGLYYLDTRFLSRWIVTIDGKRLTPLSVDDLQYFEARFFLVPGQPTHYVNATLSVIRHRSIVSGLDEELQILNHSGDPADLTIRLDAASDFADLDDIGRPAVRKKGRYHHEVGNHHLHLRYSREGFHRATLIQSTEPAEVDRDGMTFAVRIPPNGSWATRLRVATDISAPSGDEVTGGRMPMLRKLKEGVREDLDRWIGRAPRLQCDFGTLTATYRRSLIDLAALRSPSIEGGGQLPCAGLPWLNTLIGRQSIFISLQTLPFLPELAATTLRTLAAYQGTKLDDFREEEPGKILHLLRWSESTAFEERPYARYFGSVDATPLFVVLLDEYERWTGDVELVRRLENEARRALNWLDEWGDLAGDGYLWYQRPRAPGEQPNQSWKESERAICYADGRLPGFPRATCEVQGYAYDAKIRGARLARTFWGDPGYADRLEHQAYALRERFNRDYWLPDRRYYALARETDGSRVDALASNLGHLLWSGIVDPDRAEALVEHLLGPRLFSGWGVRTLAAGQSNFNPVGYHIGTVWPYDNSVIAEGMRRYGFTTEAGTVAQAIFEAGAYFNGRLPEAFAGYDRQLTTFPVRYPTASSPQGWSAGAILSLLRTVLGLETYGDHLVVKAAVPPRLGQIALLGICGRWGIADALGRPSTTASNC